VRWALLVLGTAVLYFAVAKLSLVFAVPPGFASAVWPPSGIAVAALMLGGSSLWPGVWIGLAAANFTVQPSLGTPLAIGAGGALEALFIAWASSRVIGRPEALFSDAGHVFRFVGVTLAGTAISATIANATLLFAGTVSLDNVTLNWLTWWLGDAMGVLLVAPLLLALVLRRGSLPAPRTVELAAAFAVLIAVIGLVFFWAPESRDTRPIVFLLLPPIIWIAARFDALAVTAAAATACALAMYATVLGRGPFVSESLNESLLLQQAFVCTIAAVGLALTVSVNALRRAHRELQVFVNLASHDLQEPVRNTMGYADLLQTRYGAKLDDDGREFLQYIVTGALRMRKLIDDILTLSRFSGLPPALERTETTVTLRAALANLSAAITDSGAQVTSDALPAVLAEPTLLQQLFQNLVGNALKFHGADAPRIHVSSRREGGMHVISVRDNGIGIAPEHQQRIFEMFERLHGRSSGGGVGIGLALCRRIVERSSGRLWLQSEPMKGATFYFSLPAADDAP
jgi:signal transduction histidine kinase